MRFNHLILLIGTNPLPNFVVAEYFLQNNRDIQNIWLVHSEKTGRQEGTIAQAENLEKVLKERYNNRLSFPLPKVALSNISNAEQILNDINDKLISGLPHNCNAHLNYTGGTKVMGIHVYRAIEKEKKISEKSFSYLDGREFQIIDDGDGIITTGDLRNEISITFEELIKLHGFKRNNEDNNKDFSDAVAVFKKIICEKKLDEYFDTQNGGYDRTLFENSKKPGRLAEKVSELKVDLLKKIKPNKIFLFVINAMPEDYRLFDTNGNFVQPKSKEQCKSAIGFLDGDWQEYYVYDILTRALKGQPNIQVLKNWEIKKDGWNTNFQLDVILLRGYQLIGISCTTAYRKDLCKSKGFEIIHRTRQIGGDEAKAILITRLSDEHKKNLQEELEVDTGGTSANILVLGNSDLEEKRLIKEISEFISQ